jgi:hypothetical protein
MVREVDVAQVHDRDMTVSAIGYNAIAQLGKLDEAAIWQSH